MIISNDKVNDDFQFRGEMIDGTIHYDCPSYQLNHNSNTTWLAWLYDEFVGHTLARSGDRTVFHPLWLVALYLFPLVFLSFMFSLKYSLWSFIKLLSWSVYSALIWILAPFKQIGFCLLNSAVKQKLAFGNIP